MLTDFKPITFSSRKRSRRSREVSDEGGDSTDAGGGETAEEAEADGDLTDREGGGDATPEMTEEEDEEEDVVIDLEKGKDEIQHREEEEEERERRERATRSERRKRGREQREGSSSSRTSRPERSRSPIDRERRRRSSRSPSDRDRRKQRDRREREEHEDRERRQQQSHQQHHEGDEVSEEAPAGSSANVISLSVEETNKLRASLGLAPLKDDSKPTEEDEEKKRELEAMAKKEGGTLIPGSRKNEIHKAPENLAQKSLADKLKDRIAERKKKREMEAKMLTVKKLGDSDGEDDSSATAWVKKQKKAKKEKEKAAKAAKMFEALDDEFGVGSLVAEDARVEKGREYTRSDLGGLRVEHGADSFSEGKSVILTLKDADILDGEADDTLINVNIADDERTKKRLVDIKKAKVGYNAYENEEVDELTGEIKKKNMLDKYDEEIDGEFKKSFTIGSAGQYSEEEEIRRERERIKAKLKAKKAETLEMPAPKLASDYLTAEEAKSNTKFKKPKKKRKVKKRMLKADDLIPMGEGEGMDSHGSRNKATKEEPIKTVKQRPTGERGAMPMDIDDDDIALPIKTEAELADIKVEDEDDLGLELALSKARRLKQKKVVKDGAERILEAVKQEPRIKQEEEDVTGSEFINTFEEQNLTGTIILNETAEFCRNLGARHMSEMQEKFERRHGQSHHHHQHDPVDDDLRDFEESLKSSSTKQHEQRGPTKRGHWEEVGGGSSNEEGDNSGGDNMELDSGDEEWVEGGNNAGTKKRRSAILDEEPDLQTGVAAAIKLAESKGYWEKDDTKQKGANLKHLLAKNYTIDDKIKDDHDRSSSSRGRDRYSGPSTSFSEKPGYTPTVKLEYIDDSGRLLNQKEAFRYLSHKFHGKGSGKMKTEKRMKKIMESSLMKNMSSTDTPLQTLEKLKKKQKDCATPYVVLSGSQMNTQDLRK